VRHRSWKSGDGAKQVIESSSASFLGLSIIVDQLVDDRRTALGRVEALVRHDELP
jgi:hypothetical protein